MTHLLRIEAKFYVCDRNNKILRDVTPLIASGRVTGNVDRKVQVEFTGKALTSEPLLRPFEEFMAPVLRVYHSDHYEEQQLGLFATPPPSNRTYTRGSTTADLDGRDLTWLLDADAISDWYTVSGTTDPVSAAVSLITGAGFTRVSIPLSGKTLGTARSYEPDTPRLTVINDLLGSVGYYQLMSDRTGILTSRPYMDLQRTEPSARYTSQEHSEIVGTITEGISHTSFANVIVVKREDPSNPANSFRATRVDDNPASLTYVGRIGRFVRTIQDTTLVDQAAAEASADRYFQESRSYYRTLTLSVLPDPNRWLREIYELDIRQRDGTVVADGRWWGRTFEVGFTPSDAVMKLELNRTENYDTLLS